MQGHEGVVDLQKVNDLHQIVLSFVVPEYLLNKAVKDAVGVIELSNLYNLLF
jgi:hypothetical protein